MPFWKKIKDWFGGNKAIDSPQKANESLVEAKPPKQLNTKDETRVTDAIIKETRGFFSILFKNKDKHMATMLNSITLSSDMKTLYLIDNGRAIAYDLTVAEGVLVGLLGNQLVVATAVAPPPPIEVEDLPKDRATRAEKFSFKATKDSQYTLTYNEQNQTLGIIGFDDIDASIEAPDDDTCKEHRFEMKGNQLVRLFYKNEVLEIYHEQI